MQTDGLEESDNVEDQRGRGPAVGAAVGGGGLIIFVLALVFGVNPNQLAGLVGNKGPGGGGGGGGAANNGPVVESDQEKKDRVLVSRTLRDTEKVWEKVFQDKGKTYRKPHLDLFRGRTTTGCGGGEAAMGPFYCPEDEKVYIDLSFFDEMKSKLGIPGDFPKAYVIAHEVGHHVQKLTGYSARADAARGTATELQMSVRLELQADYLAGVWAHYAEQRFRLTDDDIKDAINAAHQIGDDVLQKAATGRINTDKFTHGSAFERMKWFKKGYDTGSFDGMAEIFSVPYSELDRLR